MPSHSYRLARCRLELDDQLTILRSHLTKRFGIGPPRRIRLFALSPHTNKLLGTVISLLTKDERSPLRGRRVDEVAMAAGRIHLKSDPSIGEAYVDVLARHRLDELTVLGESNPKSGGTGMAPAGAHSALFAEIRVDKNLGLVRVARLVSVVDAGRVLNAKTARSQILGGAIMGIGMALLEETSFDRTGWIANATLADYLIPANADVPDIEVVFVGERDRFNPIGSKGLGEIGLMGVSAAIANAVYHATGKRIRSLPITLDKLL